MHELEAIVENLGPQYLVALLQVVKGLGQHISAQGIIQRQHRVHREPRALGEAWAPLVQLQRERLPQRGRVHSSACE
jgi:hypothetical protein